MKKYAAMIMALVLAFTLFVPAAMAEGNAISVVTTIFPIYDWVRALTADVGAIDLTMLLDNGVDLHSYQPTAADMMKIATCDVFIYVGGESDAWVEDALKEAVNEGMIIVNLLDALGDNVKMEEIVEGMEHEHDEDHDEDHDEHIWLSLENARDLTAYLASVLAQADPAHADSYRASSAAYGEQLDALDDAYEDMVEASAFKTVLFGDRFPFRYLVDDYDLDYYAAFAGCSAETEASFQTIVFLSGKLDELGLNAVLTIEGTDHRIAETIIKNSRTGHQEILTMDSMQGTTSADMRAGATYLTIMQKNLEALRQALN